MRAPADFASLPEPPLQEPPAATPRHVQHPQLLGDRLAIVRDAFGTRRVRFAYSVKTNPEPRMLREALALGMDMEAITQAEAELTVREGGSPDRLVLNGPGKWWPTPAEVQCRALFVNNPVEFDVINDLRAEGMRLTTHVVGLRLASTEMGSRFGVCAEDGETLDRAARRLRLLRDSCAAGWGVHVHHAQSAAGTEKWIQRCAKALEGVRAVARVMQTPPQLVDFGGGWRANDLGQVAGAVDRVVQSAPELLSQQDVEWEFEFGKALVEPLGVVYSRVLMPPDAGGAVIVDAGMGDMFEGMVSPHRTFVWRDKWIRVPPGDSLIYGRTCVEHDVLVRSVNTSGLKTGDVLAFADAGAYDVALSFDFTNGKTRSGWFS